MGIEAANRGEATRPVMAARSVSACYARQDVLGRPGPAVAALRDVSLEMRSGQTLGVVGPSGSGKSTLAKCLVLLERPTAGAIFFEDRDLLQLSAHELRLVRRNIQLIFQDSATALNPQFTVEETIGEPVRIHEPKKGQQERRRRVMQVMEELSLPKLWLSRRPGELSGGQRQRVAIARALVVRPKVVLLDEALSALDLSAQAQIVNLLLEQQARHDLSYLFISHDLDMARHLSDRIVILRQGSICSELNRDRRFTGKPHGQQEAVATCDTSGDTVPGDTMPIASTLPDN